jgi:hypothetical protein
MNDVRARIAETRAMQGSRRSDGYEGRSVRETFDSCSCNGRAGLESVVCGCGW